MSSTPSGFLNCFLKFIQGEKSEKLSNGTENRGSARFTITMAERRAILTASSKRLNQDQKASEPKATTEKKRGKPKLLPSKPMPRSSRSRGSTSEVESEVEVKDESDSKSENEERLCAKSDADVGDECVPNVQKPEKASSGDEGGPSGQVEPQSDGSSGESGKTLRDMGQSSGKNVESNKKKITVSTSNEEESAANEGESAANEGESAANKGESAANEGESAASGSPVILNGEANKGEEKVADLSSSDSAAVTEKKKRGRKRKSDTDEDGTPRRKLSSRKAKQKAKISYAESGDEEDIPGLDDNSDSDDPVWVPEERRGSSDEGSNFRWSKYEKLNLKPKKQCSYPRATSLPEIKKEVEESKVKQVPMETINKETSRVGVASDVNLKGKTGSKSELATKPTTTTSAANSNGHIKGSDNTRNPVATSHSTTKLVPVEKSDLFNPSLTVMPFQSGTFIAQHSDLEEKEEPPIWRVDGKSLLQKYEPFRSSKGNIWYRNVSTYSGWGPKSNLKYQEVPVRFIKQNRIETVVEIIQAELRINEDKLCEKLMKESEKHAYAYEVFVQTLVSHALDSNFLPEIIAEKDEYFLNCVEEMDKVSAEKKNKLIQACQWPRRLTESLRTWPIMALGPELPIMDLCSVCYVHKFIAPVKMDGNPYKYTTLEYEPPSEESFKSKELKVCSACIVTLKLFHKISHLKYHTYEEGVRMVAEKKALDPNKNNTSILHDILSDGPRVQKEFYDISLMWAQADMKSRRLKAVEEKKNIPIK